MNICFVETEPKEQAFFEGALASHDLCFCSGLEEISPDTQILSVFINSTIDAAFLDKHPSVRLIATRSTTCDHIDLAACAARGVAVASVPGYGDHTVAEHTFALLLAISRRLRDSMNLKNGAFSYELLRGFELSGKTLGIVGTGRIGAQTIRLAKCFGMKVIAYDLNPRPALAEQLGFEYVWFEDLLRRSDIISLHCNLTQTSHHLLNREGFAKCRPGVVIINTARGRLIDTDALREAMDAGIVAAAGLDVLEEERVMRQHASHIVSDEIIERLHHEFKPEEARVHDMSRVKALQKLMHNSELLSRPNVVFTPHIAFNSVEAIDRINRLTVQNIVAFAVSSPQHATSI